MVPDSAELQRLARGEHHDPHHLLGTHHDPGGTVIRAFHPDASGADLVAPNGGALQMDSGGLK